MSKSTEAEKRAAKKYAQTVDKAGVVLPKGTKEKIVGMGEAGVSQYINRLVEKMSSRFYLSTKTEISVIILFIGNRTVNSFWLFLVRH